MVSETGGYEPSSNRAVIEPVTVHEGHVKIGADIPDLGIGKQLLAATYKDNVKTWLSAPGREAYYLTWPEEDGEMPRGIQLGEGTRIVSIGGTRDEYLLADQTDPTSVIGRYDIIKFPKVPNKESMLAYIPGPDEQLFHPLNDPSNPYAHYEAGRHVIDTVLGETQNPPSEEDFEVNPVQNQTSTGLMLEFEFGHPKYLWTPMGQIDIGRHMKFSKNGAALVEAFMQKGLHLEQFMPLRTTSGALGGTFGPTYAVVGIGEDTLPTPGLKQRGDYYPPDAAKSAWEEFGQIYTQSK